jgi:succinyl-diaminopimelate desuccinylase
MAAPLIDPVALAQDLIRCPSVTPADAGALPLLARILEAQGFKAETLTFSAPGTPDIDNLWARIGTGGKHFCFAGHTDVVPPGERERWRADPFAAEIRDGWLIGRGAADMKGAIAAFAGAASRFLAHRPGFGGSISLLITGDEEGPSINGTAKVLDWLDARAERIDACLIGEPTSARTLGDVIKIGRRGSMNVWLTVLGVGGHTAYPQLADNAAHRLVAMLGALTSRPIDAGTAHFEPSTLQISTIDIGNPTTNVIPAKARACVNIRFNDAWTSKTLEAWLRETLDKVGGTYELEVRVSGEAFLTPPGAFADLVAASIREVAGVAADFTTGGGTSDARFIHRWCPVAEFGLVGQTMHKIDEAVPVADIEQLSRVYEGVLDRFFAES